MKKMKLRFGMFALVAGAIVAFAFSPAPMEKAADDEPIYEWYSPDLSEHLATGTKTQQTASCQGGNTLCARAFESMDEEGNPAGPQKDFVNKP